MKNLILSISIATCCVSLAGFAIAQTVALPPVNAPDEQLQRVPVSGLHIGQPGAVKNPYEGNKDAWMEGKKLFGAMNCVGCHAPGGGGAIGPPLSDKVWIYGGDPGQIYLSIEHGRPNGMPQWGTALPPQAIWALVTYVETLSNPNQALEPVTTFGSHSGSGNGPHPAAAKEPPPMPKQEKRTPQPPKPAHPAPPMNPQPSSSTGNPQPPSSTGGQP